MRNRFLNLVVALGLVTGLLVGAVGSAGAAVTNGNTVPSDMAGSTLYFPFVPNGAVINGVGPFFGTVTVQNLEEVPINITLSNTSGVTQQTAPLNPHASKTFSANSLNIPTTGNMVGGIKVTSTWQSTTNPAYLPSGVTCGTTSPSTSGAQINVTRSTTAGQMIDAFAAPAGQTINSVTSIQYGTTTYTPNVAGGPTVTINPNGQAATIDWTGVAVPPPPGAIYQVNYRYTTTGSSQNCSRQPYIGGVEKHMAAGDTSVINGNNGSAVSDGATVVDGYTGVSGADLPAGTGLTGVTAGPLGTIILPIVQKAWPTAGSWDSTIYISNLSGVSNVGATITFYGAATQGVAGTSVIVPRHLMAAGETWAVNLSTVTGLPANFVGSAWISVDEPQIVAAVSRNKTATMMSLTNTAAPFSTSDCSRLLDVPNQYPTTGELSCESSPVGNAPVPVTTLTNYYRFAPLVFRDYNNWNTGLNVANLSDVTNTVTFTYYNYSSNMVATGQINIPPRAMEYVYRPGNGTDSGVAEGAITSAVISATAPIHVAVDEVKYMGEASTPSNQAGTGNAMSYMAVAHGAKGLLGAPSSGTVNTATPGPINHLAVPLFQKGDPTSGLGDTSGVNLFNFGVAGIVDVVFYDESGAPTAPTAAVNPAQPTVASPIELDMGPLSSATLYSLDPGYSEMPVGFVGSVDMSVVNVGSEVTAVSNNVNYSIAGDGAAVYNALATQGNFLFNQGNFLPAAK